MWQPETWVQLLQPIVNFLNQVVQRLGCHTEHQLQQMQQSVASLQQTAQAFKEHGACAGDYSVMNNLGNLDRQAVSCCFTLAKQIAITSILHTSISGNLDARARFLAWT